MVVNCQMHGDSHLKAQHSAWEVAWPCHSDGQVHISINTLHMLWELQRIGVWMVGESFSQAMDMVAI